MTSNVLRYVVVLFGLLLSMNISAKQEFQAFNNDRISTQRWTERSDQGVEYFVGVVRARYIQDEQPSLDAMLKRECGIMLREFSLHVNKLDEFYTCSREQELRDQALDEAANGIMHNFHEMGSVLRDLSAELSMKSKNETISISINRLNDQEVDTVALAYGVQEKITRQEYGVFNISGCKVTIKK